MIKSLRIIFAGTPNYTSIYLNKLINSKHKVVCILTQPIKHNANYNKKKILPNEIRFLSKQYNIPLLEPLNLIETKYIEIIKNLNADIIIVIAYGLIFPKNILNITKFGCINVHFSLLPLWRGAAPVQRALCNGDKITGISIIKMNTNLDSGKILYQKKCSISPNDTSFSLCEKLSKIGIKSLLLVLEKIINKKVTYKIQNHFIATYAKKINKKEGKIDWNKSAIYIERQVRAFNPWPSTYFFLNEKLIKVWKSKTLCNEKCYKNPGTILSINNTGIYVSTGKGILILTLLQISGKRKNSFLDFFNSYRTLFIKNKILY
ncbi:MAG: methionyl-tRNA formyltransferase [Enterobacterales bacterium]